MDWRALKELKLAEQAERDFGGGGDFGEAPAPASSWSKPISFSESESPYTVPQTHFQSTPSAPDPFAKVEEAAVKLGGESLGMLGDALSTTIGPIASAGRAVGGIANNLLPDETMAQITGTRNREVYSPTKELGRGAQDLLGVPYRLGNWLEGKPTNREGAIDSWMHDSMEAMGAPGAYGKVVGGLNLLGSLSQPGAMGKIPFTNVNPLFDAGKGGASFIKHVMRERPADASMFDWAVRRGAINMPGKPQLTQEQSNRLLKVAAVLADGNNEKLSDFWIAGAERARELDTMDDAALMGVMKDFGLKQQRKADRNFVGLEKAEQVANPMSQPMKASHVEPESLMNEDTARELLAGMPLEGGKIAEGGRPSPQQVYDKFTELYNSGSHKKLSRDAAQGIEEAGVEDIAAAIADRANNPYVAKAIDEVFGPGTREAVKPVRASTYAPRGEAAADAGARLERVRKAIQSNGDIDQIMADAELLPRDDVFDLALELGVNAERNKSKGLKGIREAIEKKALEPTQPPTTAIGRQELRELEVAKQAEKTPIQRIEELSESLPKKSLAELQDIAKEYGVPIPANKPNAVKSIQVALQQRASAELAGKVIGGFDAPANGKPVAAGGQTAMEPSTLGAGHGEVSGQQWQQGRPAEVGQPTLEGGQGPGPEAGPIGQGQPTGQPNAQPAVGGQPQPGRGLSEQVTAKRAAPEIVNKKTWYHGSGTAGISAKNVDPGHTDISSLFGEGIYLTDSADIAKGYSKARSKTTGTPSIYQAKVNVGETLDLELPSPPAVKAAIEDFSKGWLEQDGYRFNDNLSKAIKEPNATTESLYSALAKDMQEYSIETGTSKADMADFSFEFVRRMRKLGYDALTHTGGKRTGKNPHQVLVVLDPHDTSMTGRTGHISEFSPVEGEQPLNGAGLSGEATTPSSATGRPPSTPRSPSQPPPLESPTAGPPSTPGMSSSPSAPAPLSASISNRPERNATGFAKNHIDMLENASLRANNAEGRALAEKLRDTIVYGESNAARPMKRLNDSGEVVSRSPAAREEVADLFTPSAWTKIGAPDLRVGRFQAAVDDSADLVMIRPQERMLQSPEARQYAADYIDEISSLGHEAERLGVVTASGNPFVAKERRFIQQIDPSAKDWMVDGDPLFDKLKTQLAAVYPDQDINAMGDALKAMANVPLDRPAAFEFERAIPMTPAAIVDDAGVTRPILRYVPIPTAVNTSNPAARIVESQWMRLGGIKALGQDIAKTLAETDDAALAGSPLGAALQAGGKEVSRAARGAIGAIYRRPEAGITGANPANWRINKENTPFWEVMRSAFGRVTPALNLGLQGLKSIPQTIGEVPAMTGIANYAKAVGKVATQYGKASEEAEIAGAIHRKFLMSGSEVFDRHRLIESVLGANVNRTYTERFNDFVKDLNDTIAYTAGTFKADRMFAKGAKKSDFIMMDEMNLPQSVQEVFRNPSAFDDAARASARQTFGRSIAKESQFHSKNPALKGRFENDAALRWIMPYMGYSINTAKNTFKDFERVIRLSKEGTDGSWLARLNPFGEREPFRNALTKLTGRFIGMELAGEVVADLSSASQGKDPLRKDRSLTGRFLENLSYVGFLGPLHFAFDMAAANLLEGDEKKKFADARAGSRAPTLGNPTIEAGFKAAKDLAKGDIGDAAYDLTIGQSPALGGIGRASGLIEPSNSSSGEQRLYNRRGSKAEDRLFNRRGTSDSDRLFNRRGSTDKDRLFQRPKRN